MKDKDLITTIRNLISGSGRSCPSLGEAAEKLQIASGQAKTLTATQQNVAPQKQAVASCN